VAGTASGVDVAAPSTAEVVSHPLQTVAKLTNAAGTLATARIVRPIVILHLETDVLAAREHVEHVLSSSRAAVESAPSKSR
jgi:hypothetical protein